MSSDKTGVVLRCDDIDGVSLFFLSSIKPPFIFSLYMLQELTLHQNCKFPGWRGHWRGNNATTETVICDASYTDRRYNIEMCMKGYKLTNAAPSTFWSIDLFHRLLHVPTITDGAVDHYASGLAGAVQLAKTNATYSPFDSDTLQYFAAHVYINEVVKGGDSCIGDIAALPAPTADAHGAPLPSATGSPASAAAPTTSRAAASSATSSRAVSSAAAAASASAAGADCHTHADGSIHCGAH